MVIAITKSGNIENDRTHLPLVYLACYSEPMDKDVRVARALSARLARRMLRLATIIVVFVLAVLFGAVWALAHFLSAWWWLLLLPLSFLFGFCLLAGVIAHLIARRLYTQKLSGEQVRALDAMADTVQRLLEARATPWPVLVLISIKDLLIRRDVTTLKELVRDTASLRSEYSKLRRLF